MAQSDETIRRFLAGDAEAFNQLVRQWETRIFNLAWRFLGNREDAQDVMQETFLSVFQSLAGLREPRSFPTWIYRITLNHCRARWRARQPVISLDQPSPEGDGGEGALTAVLQTPSGAERVEAADLIRKAIAGISEDHRAAIILKEYLGLSLEEVAVVMDCPLSTAKSRLYHGLRGVQRNLKRISPGSDGPSRGSHEM